MPGAWSQKDERKYQHIKDSQQDRGASEDRAEEIAARTVNKGRRESGRTPNATSQGTGNPNVALENRSKQELYNKAQDLEIEGRSKMKKDELVTAIRERE